MRSSAQNTSNTISGMRRYGQIAGRRSRGPPVSSRPSAAIEPHELGLAERGEVHVETDERRARVRQHVELFDLERVEPEVVPVGLPGRRARAAVSRRAEVRATLNRAGGHQALLRI